MYQHYILHSTSEVFPVLCNVGKKNPNGWMKSKNRKPIEKQMLFSRKEPNITFNVNGEMSKGKEIYSYALHLHPLTREMKSNKWIKDKREEQTAMRKQWKQ